MTDETRTDSRLKTLNAIKILLSFLVFVVAAAALKIAASVLIPLVLAVFLLYLIGPIMSWLARHRVPHALTLPATFLLLGGVVFVLYLFMVPTINELASQAPLYMERLQVITESLLAHFGVHEVDWVESVGTSVSENALSFFSEVINFVGNFVLVIIYTVFLILGRESIGKNVGRAFSEERSKELLEMMGKINISVQRYIQAKILLSLATGLCMGLALWLFGVDFAIFWGLLGFLLNFIPTIGSAIAAILPICLAALQFGSIKVLWVAMTLIAIQQLIGNVVEPQVQGKRLNMSPIVVLFSLVFFGWLWGFWGMVLSVPLAAVAKIAMEETKTLRPIAIMLEK